MGSVSAALSDTRDIPIIVVSGTDTSDLKDSDFACISFASHCIRTA